MPAFPASDPNGFYDALGLAQDASVEEVKSAYRLRAKELHPDHNPSADAKAEFQRVMEAYGILRDARKKADYDETCRRSREAHMQTGLASVSNDDDETQPLSCSCCGKVTAQPRFVVFHRVKSAFLVSKRLPVQGIFCRNCADRTAIKASTYSWTWGWWGVFGPFFTIIALLRNLLGGDMPAEENARILLHQARAFDSRRENDVARSLAEQALPFARKTPYEKPLRALLQEGGPMRRLRNRWKIGGSAFVVQLLPLAALPATIGILFLLILDTAGPSSVMAGIDLPRIENGEIRHVAVDLLKMRQSPDSNGAVIALLDRFTTIQVLEADAGGTWVKVVTPTGLSGWVANRLLFSGPGIEPRRRWCEDQKGDRPESGTVMIRRTSGEHRLLVHNEISSDAVVKLKTISTNSTLLSFFVPGGATVSIGGIPEGSFRVLFAVGSDYSRGCGVFLSRMEALAVPAPITFKTPTGRSFRAVVPPELTLWPGGMGAGQPKSIAIEHFVKDD